MKTYFRDCLSGLNIDLKQQCPLLKEHKNTLSKVEYWMNVTKNDM